MMPESIEWVDFERVLVEYRDKYYLKGTGEKYYFEICDQLLGQPIRMRAQHSQAIVKFLNRWRCHLARKYTPLALQSWITREADSLDKISSLSIEMPDVPVAAEELSRLHDSLIALNKAEYGMLNMGPAAASKILHLMIPSLFVMWDAKIRLRGSSYGEFMSGMHKFALILCNSIAPIEARGDLPGFIQERLGYPVRKPLAKYLDEYKWHLTWSKILLSSQT